MEKIIQKIKRKLTKWCLQPIRVFCLHHVCAQFDGEWMNRGDWMEIDEFKQKVLALQQSGVKFISLTEAHHRLLIASSPFAIRLKRYAVLTFDDGYATLKDILPWLHEQHIPVTLFINGKYLDGVSFRTTAKECYLTLDELMQLNNESIEVGHHGWEHIRADKMTEVEFIDSLDKNICLLVDHPRYIPFYAYTYGNFTLDSEKVLQNKNFIPVYVDGQRNYNDASCIHRELL